MLNASNWNSKGKEDDFSPNELTRTTDAPIELSTISCENKC